MSALVSYVSSRSVALNILHISILRRYIIHVTLIEASSQQTLH